MNLKFILWTKIIKQLSLVKDFVTTAPEMGTFCLKFEYHSEALSEISSKRARKKFLT